MGRSGTSAVTRMFHRSGYFVGAPADVMPADESNPTGHFENLRIYEVNEQLLRELGGTWFDAPAPEEQLALGATAGGRVRDALEDLLAVAGGAPLALKDPRIGMLLALWWPCLEGVLHPVLVVRHPVEIALSLERRDGTAPPVALAMWELHTTRLLRCLHGQRVTVVPYGDALEEPQLASSLVAAASAELRAELRPALDSTQATSALEPGIRRSRVEESSGARWLTDGQRKLWGLLGSLQAGTTLLQASRMEEPGDEVLALTRYEAQRQRREAEADARLRQAAVELVECNRRLEQRGRELAAQSDALSAASRLMADLEVDLESACAQRDSTEERLRAAEHWQAATRASRGWRVLEALRARRRRVRRIVEVRRG